MVFELVTDSAGNVGGENGKVNMLKRGVARLVSIWVALEQWCLNFYPEYIQ